MTGAPIVGVTVEVCGQQVLTDQNGDAWFDAAVDTLAFDSGVVFFANVEPGLGIANAYDPNDHPCGIVAALLGGTPWELQVNPEEISVIGFQ